MYRSISANAPSTWAVEFDGKPIYDVVWADDSIGQVEVFCHDSRGCRIAEPGNSSGYQTILLKGEVKITDLEPPTSDPTQMTFDRMWGNYPGFCFLVLDNKIWYGFHRNNSSAVLSPQAMVAEPNTDKKE